MTKDEITCMARQAGWTEYSLLLSVEVQRLERFAKLVYEHTWEEAGIAATRTVLDAAILEEREACAKLCDELSVKWWRSWKKHADPQDQGLSDGADICAQEIRKRGQV